MESAKISNDRIRLSAWMRENYPSLTMSHLQKLCRTGQIRANGSRVAPADALSKGDELRLPPFINEYKDAAPRPKAAKYAKADAEALLSRIIYEDDEIIAIDKPSGLAAQGGTGITKSADDLANFAMPQYEGSLRLAHRIDKDTSGILVIAKGYEAARKLSAMFAERKIKKEYLALAYGTMQEKSGRIDAPLSREEGGEAKRAVSEYRVLDEALGLVSLVSLFPLTGRTHQLRLHMAHIGHAIAGDFKYGDGARFSELKGALDIDIARALYLHAHKIKIEGKPEISAPMPGHMAKICEYLGFPKRG